MGANLKLKNARENADLTQAKTAQKVNISERAYQRYEAGERVPNVYTAQLIAKAVNSAVEDLFEVSIPEKMARCQLERGIESA